MKKWMNAEITELELKCTESGSDVTAYKDDVRQDPNDPNKMWYSFSSTTD